MIHVSVQEAGFVSVLPVRLDIWGWGFSSFPKAQANLSG